MGVAGSAPMACPSLRHGPPSGRSALGSRAAAWQGRGESARVGEETGSGDRSAYEVLAPAGRWRWLEGKAHCCFCSAVKFQGKNAVACSGGWAPASAQAVK